MVEFTAREGHNGHRELTEFGVVDSGVSAKGTTEFGVEVVLFQGGLSDRTAGNSTTLSKEADSTVREEPDTDVCEVEVVLQKVGEAFR